MKTIDRRVYDSLLASAGMSARKRAHHNLHEMLEDPIQRLWIGIEPGSYIRPHRHTEPGKWEFFLALSGSAVVLVFDPQGKVEERIELSHRGPVFGVEIPPGAWHALAATSSGTILMELKPGPYRPISDKDFAAWAPPEGAEGAEAMEAWFRTAGEGSKPEAQPLRHEGTKKDHEA
jgi:cupin fold WbuC family metalloprotein